MKAEWLSAPFLPTLWERLKHGDYPFAEAEWWETLNIPWGAVIISERGEDPIAAFPLALRQVGVVKLYRQPLGMPWIPIRTIMPLPTLPPQRYREIGHILHAFAQWIRKRHLAYVGGILSPEWSYLPPLSTLGIRGHGSFILRPGAFHPSKELLRKVRSTERYPLQTLSPLDAYAWWRGRRPKGVSSRFVHALGRLVILSQGWWCIGIGDPLQAVGLFVMGEKRMWYLAGATTGTGQTMTRLLYEAIIHAHQQEKVFDFMGSVLPGVERFFRQFGGEWEVRYAVHHWQI